MFTFDDSPLSGTAGQNEFAAPGSPTPIFDRLFEEWQRMFRAVPGDRYGEGFAAATGMRSGAQSGMQSGIQAGLQSGVQVYSSGGYSVPSSMPVPAFRAEAGQGQGYPQSYGSSGGYGLPQNVQHGGSSSGQPGSSQGQHVSQPMHASESQMHVSHLTGSSMSGSTMSVSTMSGSAMSGATMGGSTMGGSTMNTPPPMHAQGAYESYAQPSRPSPMPNRQPSGLALMPVAGYQAQHMPL
ncbi:hypothetical protein OG216_12330 [Streptomycetaceae bacterium NBC_01309]